MATAQDAMRVRTLSAREVRYDRHPRPKHDAGGICVGQKGEVFGEHVAGLEVGHDQNLSLPCNR